MYRGNNIQAPQASKLNASSDAWTKTKMNRKLEQTPIKSLTITVCKALYTEANICEKHENES